MKVSGAMISGHYPGVKKLFRSAGATLMATALASASLSGCATSARPRPEPVAAVLTPPTEQPVPPPVVAPVPPPPAAPQPRLPWVNPARCLPVCAMDPSASLVQVNERGELAPGGRHRVAAEVQQELQALIAAARASGHNISVSSAFRSYEAQARLFEQIKEAGRAARPGHSEHQLGTTIDLRLPTGAAIEWLAAHAADFSFALSYPPGKQRTTGYRPEPWHIRFVGPELAKELHGSGLILEELFRKRPTLAESGSCADCPLPASRTECGAQTSAGSCAGTVLSWCYDGSLATVDCAVSGQSCGQSPGGDFDCLPKARSEAETPAEP